MSRRWRVSAALVAAACLLTGCAAEHEVTDAAPLAGVSLSGEAFDLDDLRGQVVLVTVWASWCGPCREEVPVLNEALDSFADEEFRIVGLNFRDHPDAAQRFVEQESPAFPSIRDVDGRIGVGWGVHGLPQSFLVDRGGKVVARHFGAVEDSWITEIVAPEIRR